MKTELNKVGFLTILMLLGVLHVNAINVQRVLQGDTLNNKVDSTVQTMYIIEGDCSLSGDVSLAPGSILKFEGGMINGPGTIKSLCLIIDAPKYQIFKENVSVSGIANGEVSVHWWGAVGDGVTEDADAINRALKAAGTSWVVLDNLKYKIKAPITLNKEGQKLKCYGNISYNPSNPDSSYAAIDLRASNIELDINKLSGPDNGSGVLFSWNVFHGNINVNEIEKFKYGLNLTPVANVYLENEVFAGVQYCKISWQTIKCNIGIYIDLWSDQNLDSCTVWVNENQFNGGRLMCNNGIVVADKIKKLNLKSYTADLINGNVFNCIGFEGSSSSLITPIILRHAWYNEFHDLRMSESLEADTTKALIYMNDCGYNTMNIKSILPYSRIKAENCNNIELQGSFTDYGAGFHKGYDRMYIVNSNTAYRTPMNTKSTLIKNKTYKLLSSRIQQRNAIKNLYLGRTATDTVGEKKDTISFNELFFHPYDTKGVIILSDVVEVGIYNNSQLTIDVANSIAGICPEVEMRCNIGAGSRLIFIDNNNIIEQITSSGNYRITFNEARDMRIVKMTN